jgi:hypothetical protein
MGQQHLHPITGPEDIGYLPFQPQQQQQPLQPLPTAPAPTTDVVQHNHPIATGQHQPHVVVVATGQTPPAEHQAQLPSVWARHPSVHQVVKEREWFRSELELAHRTNDVLRFRVAELQSYKDTTQEQARQRRRTYELKHPERRSKW